MSSHILLRPRAGHFCGPDRWGEWFDQRTRMTLMDPVGTVRECDECGTVWVAVRRGRTYPAARCGALGGHRSTATVWRREGVLAAWRRHRKARI